MANLRANVPNQFSNVHKNRAHINIYIHIFNEIHTYILRDTYRDLIRDDVLLGQRLRSLDKIFLSVENWLVD